MPRNPKPTPPAPEFDLSSSELVTLHAFAACKIAIENNFTPGVAKYFLLISDYENPASRHSISRQELRALGASIVTVLEKE